MQAIILKKKLAIISKQSILIGYAPTCGVCYPATDCSEDIEAARTEYFKCPPISSSVLWNVSWWSDPVIFGRYPADGLELYKDYLP